MPDVQAVLGQFETNPARPRERRLEGKWSALKHLARLARHNHAIREWLGWITGPDNPDADPGIAKGVVRPAHQLLTTHSATDQASLATEVRALSGWPAFWLQHEGHHIYTTSMRART